MIKLNNIPLLFFFFFYICFIHYYFNENQRNSKNGFVYAQTSSLNITSLIEKKELYTKVLQDSKFKLINAQKVRTIKQAEINMIQTLSDSFITVEKKEKAAQQVKKAQIQLSAITSIIEELQFTVDTNSEAISKIDETIANKLGGVNPSLLRFTVPAGDGILVVKENSTIFGIGINKNGNLGCGNSNTPITSTCKTVDSGVLKGKIISQIKSQLQTVILTTDNTLISFGYGDLGGLGNGQLTTSNVPVLVDTSLLVDKQFKQIEVGYSGAIVVTTDGQMYGWGSNANGELCSTNQKITMPTLLPAFHKKIRKVFYQMFTSIFITEDGEVYGCGRFPTATASSFSYYTKIDVNNIDPADPIENVAIAHSALIFRTKSGSLYSMGYSAQGTLGLGDTSDRTIPTLITSLKSANVSITKVCAGPRHVVALSTDGKVYQWGTPSQISGTNAESTVTVTDLAGSTKPVRFTVNDIENHTIIDIACGGATNVAVSDRGVTFGWGKSSLFGLGSSSSFSVPTKLQLP